MTLDALPIDFDALASSERDVPSAEPYLTRWCVIHAFHLEALRQVDEVPEHLMPRVALRAAHLADRKYRIYLSSLGARGGVGG